MIQPVSNASTIEFVFALTRRILDMHNSRVTGSKGCQAAADFLSKSFPKSNVSVERFTLHPDSLWLLGKLTASSYLLCALLLNFGGFWVFPACLIGLLTIAYGAVVYFAYGPQFDRFFKKAEGINVTAMTSYRTTSLLWIKRRVPAVIPEGANE